MSRFRRNTKEEKEQILEKERQEIINSLKSMTKKELINFIDNNLYFDEDFCVDEWKIYADQLV